MLLPLLILLLISADSTFLTELYKVFFQFWVPPAFQCVHTYLSFCCLPELHCELLLHYLFIYLSIHLPNHPTQITHRSFPSINLPTHPFTFPPIYIATSYTFTSSTHLPFHPFIQPPIHSSIHQSIFLFIPPFILPFFPPSVHLSVHPSILLFIHLSTYPSLT